MRITDLSRRALAALTLALSLTACPGTDPGTVPDGGSKDGGPLGDAGCEDCCANGFCIHVLEPEETALLQLSLAVREDGSAGVAYFHRVSDDDYEVRYREWKAGQTSEPETVATVQNVHGVSLAFTGSGQAAVSYLGGTDAETSIEWLQSDAVVSFRNGDGTWSEQVVVTDGNQAPAGNPVSDFGAVVGLHPALGFTGETAHLVYRDVHGGQNSTDYSGSDLEYAGGRQSWEHAVVIPGGDEKLGWGGHSQLVIADGQPAVLSDKLSRGPEGQGVDVVFSRRKADGSWTQHKVIAEVADTQLGPSLAHHPGYGYAVAVHEATVDRLDFLSSTDGNVWTNPPIPVVQEGSSGWYPSVAINPVGLAPSIAYYVCNRRLVANQSDCSPEDDSLRIAFRRSADWGDRLVDPEGGFAPRLAFLPDGRALVVYRHPFTGVLKLAVQQ